MSTKAAPPIEIIFDEHGVARVVEAKGQGPDAVGVTLRTEPATRAELDAWRFGTTKREERSA